MRVYRYVSTYVEELRVYCLFKHTCRRHEEFYSVSLTHVLFHCFSDIYQSIRVSCIADFILRVADGRSCSTYATCRFPVLLVWLLNVSYYFSYDWLALYLSGMWYGLAYLSDIWQTISCFSVLHVRLTLFYLSDSICTLLHMSEMEYTLSNLSGCYSTCLSIMHCILLF